ncbi:hypothetical protein Kpho02_24030 [Kitasatospora phosalacinea]|uniref:DUF4244 domain-containing protein n=1 Tax=Kitasatospora phosalacinea TaxID=2065 RepID=A0A9W6Q7Q8_9ACTN|nr:DUF4244 domain-containing protein [Kitasatospora phosalacinea]GLW70104.1 hypothetical protein Kpho02_24030 [Kitasatospora phosalacinea]
MKKPVRAARPTAVLLAARRLGVRLRHRYRRAAGQPDAGMSTAEYAIGTVAACAFAAALYKVVTSSAVSGALTEMLGRALHAV